MRLFLPSTPARRAARAAALVLAAAAAGACGTNDVGEDDEPRPSALRLTITPPGGGAAADVIVRAGTTVQLRVGTSAVTAQPLDANNQPLALDEPFEFRVVSSVGSPDASDQISLGGVFSFVSTPGTLSGTITASTTATQSAYVRLVHIEERHSDFDAAITLRAAP